MNNDLFLNTLSSTIAHTFLDAPTLPAPTCLKITISGVSGKSETTVEDVIVRITQNRFMELAQLYTTENDIPILAKKLWNDLSSHTHRKTLETQITHCIRMQNSDYDCSFIQTTDDKMYLYFRHKAELITQQPQPFAPLFRNFFNLLQEIQQGQYAITVATDTKPVLATWHLAECVAFVAFNKFTKTGIVAHIDLCADLTDFFQNLKKAVNQPPHCLEVDYVLIGGRQHSTQDHRENIKKAAEKATDVFFKFNLLKEIGEKISSEVSCKDSRWGISMRLSRSVALDTRLETPLESLMSYEPDLNPDSSLHQRSFTRLEAYKFETEREQKRRLDLIYNSISTTILQ